MIWEIIWREEAREDYLKLDGSQKKRVLKAAEKLAENPLPQSEGGYGSPLGNKHGINLTNLLKIKLRGCGLRIAYQIERTDTQAQIIVIGAREDEEIYKIAAKRTGRQ